MLSVWSTLFDAKTRRRGALMLGFWALALGPFPWLVEGGGRRRGERRVVDSGRYIGSPVDSKTGTVAVPEDPNGVLGVVVVR